MPSAVRADHNDGKSVVVRTDEAMKGFVLSKCAAKGQRCLKAEAAQAEAGHLRPIFALRPLKVTTENRVTGEKTETVAERGYIDFENNRIVMETKSGEKVYRLDDLSVDEWKMK